ncbi:hypothetical protein MTR67_053330 [Solanum verrucosum]|uniref:Uncharacterized protein n=1 Tax=Solanum verrucosum TaxID=315347 RepID=A0AAF1A3Z8_SOLVR|nr:hypothetical protein MTR67_053330 [Solanum verrucosum]
MSSIFKIIGFQKRRSCLDGDDDGDYDYAPAACLEGDGDGAMMEIMTMLLQHPWKEMTMIETMIMLLPHPWKEMAMMKITLMLQPHDLVVINGRFRERGIDYCSMKLKL